MIEIVENEQNVTSNTSCISVVDDNIFKDNSLKLVIEEFDLLEILDD